MNKTILKQKAKRLGSHLEHNVQMFRGKETGVAPKFTWQQLLPIAIVVAGIGVLIASPKTRNSLAVKIAMLVGSQFMQGGDSDE